MARRFPSDLVDPSEKRADWHLKVGQAIFDNFNYMNTDSFAKGAARYKENVEYANATYDGSIYEDLFALEDDPNNTYTNIDFTPIPLLPKYQRLVSERHAIQRFHISVNAIDPISLSEKKAYEATEMGNIAIRDEMAKAGVDTSVLQSGEIDQPMTLEELAIKMEYGYKHNTAIDLEKRIDLIFTENKINDFIFPKIRFDMFTKGIGIVKDWTDPVTKQIKCRRVDPSNFIVSIIKNEDGSDATYFGEILIMTPDEYRRYDPDITDDELQDLVQSNLLQNSKTSWLGNMEPYDTLNPKGDYKIIVLDFEYKSIDRQVFEVGTGGDMPEYERLSSDDHIEGMYEEIADVDEAIQWYRGKWVIGTDKIVDYGPLEFQKVDNQKDWDARSSFTMHAPELENMETISMVDHLKPIVDRTNIAWMKLQNVIHKARPAGLLIEMSALEDINIGNGPMKPINVVDMFTQDGNLLYRRKNLMGEYANGAPITEIQNGLRNEADQWFNVINMYIDMLKDFVGFNDASAGTTVAPRTGKGVAELQVASTHLATNHLLRGERAIYEKLAESVSIRMQDVLAFGLTDRYADALGTETIKSLSEENDYVNRIYGLEITDEPNDQQKAALELDTVEAVKNNQITLGDKYKVLNTRNIKQAEQLLSYLIKKNQENAQKIKQDDMKLQGEINTQAAQEAARAQMELDDHLTVNKIKVVDAEGRNNRENLELKYRMEKKYAIREPVMDKDNQDSGKKRGNYNPGSNKNNSKNKVKAS